MMVPKFLVLEKIDVDGTFASDAEVGETVRRLHGLSPPVLYTAAQGAQIASLKIAGLTSRLLA